MKTIIIYSSVKLKVLFDAFLIFRHLFPFWLQILDCKFQQSGFLSISDGFLLESMKIIIFQAVFIWSIKIFKIAYRKILDHWLFIIKCWLTIFKLNYCTFMKFISLSSSVWFPNPEVMINFFNLWRIKPSY